MDQDDVEGMASGRIPDSHRAIVADREAPLILQSSSPRWAAVSGPLFRWSLPCGRKIRRSRWERHGRIPPSRVGARDLGKAIVVRVDSSILISHSDKKQDGQQTVTTTLPSGDEPSNLALRSDGSRACVTNHSSNTVPVIDTRRVTATITVGDCPNGVAVSEDGRRIHAVNFGLGFVSVIDYA